MKKINQTENKVSSGKQAVSVSVGKITALIATFGIQIFLTRYLSKEEYGLYSQYLMIVFFAASIFSFGIQSNLFFFYPKKEHRFRKTYVTHTLILLCVFSLIAGVSLKIPHVSNLLTGGGKIEKYTTFIIIGVIIAMPTFIVETLYVVKRDLMTSIIFPPANEILKAIAVIAFALILPGINAVFYGLLIAMFISALFALAYSLIEINKLDKSAPLIDKNILLAQIRYSAPFGIAVIVNTIILRIDKLVSISYLSIVEYASYSVAFFGVPGIQQIFDSLGQVIIIKLVEAINIDDKKSVLHIFRQFALKTFSFTIPIVIIVCYYAKKIIVFLFSEKYIDAVPLFQLYLISFIFGMFGAGILLRASGKTKLTLYAYIITAIIIIPATYLMIPKFGVWGAMSTALLGSFLPRLFMMIMEMRVFKFTLAEYIPWRNLLMIMVVSIIAVLPLILVDIFFTYNILVSAIFSMFYLTLVFVIEINFDLFIISKQIILDKMKNLHSVI